MPRRFLSLVLVLVCLVAPSASADGVDDYVRERMREFHLPGVTIAIVDRGRVAKIAGYGLADVAGETPAAPETVYKIASVSKQFIAAAVLLLAQDGALSLDDPVSRHLPGTPPSWERITLRHLLTHTSGIVRESPAFRPMENRTDLALIEAVHPLPLRFAPGTKWEYCNVGYVTLAAIVTRVSGRPWTEFIGARVFGPLGMRDTAPTNALPRPARHAVGYDGKDNAKPADDWVALRPSGAFRSTVGDLVKWDAALDTDTVLTAATRREMWAPVRLNDGTTHPYGLGLHTGTVGGGRRVAWHSGGLPGFASYFGRFLDDGVTVILLTNGNDVDATAVGRGLAERYLASRPAAATAGR
jgi:CubicO group peptidase (beta-lactamase class C family)